MNSARLFATFGWKRRDSWSWWLHARAVDWRSFVHGFGVLQIFYFNIFTLELIIIVFADRSLGHLKWSSLELIVLFCLYEKVVLLLAEICLISQLKEVFKLSWRRLKGKIFRIRFLRAVGNESEVLFCFSIEFPKKVCNVFSQIRLLLLWTLLTQISCFRFEGTSQPLLVNFTAPYFILSC